MNNKPSKRLPPLRALLAFRSAGRHLSFKEAAEELNLTASAVSHQVKNLEDFFGLGLFERKTRAIEFTAAGRAYFNFLDSMFARLEDETHQLRAQYGRIVVRLCVPPFFASELLLPKLSEFKALMPSTDVRVSTQPSMMRVHPPEADISILLGKGGWTDLLTTPLFSHRIVVACSPALKEKFDLQSFSDLNGRTLIVHEHRPATGNCSPAHRAPRRPGRAWCTALIRWRQ